MQQNSSACETRPLRVLIVDDHEIVRRGVVALLTNRTDCVVVGEACNGLEAIDKARDLKPDIVLMDVSMPVMNGLEATRHIHNTLPSCEVLVLSQHDAPEIASQAFKAGARGYVIKSSIAQNLTAALEKIAGHEAFFDPSISETNRPVDVQEILQRSHALELALQESEQLYRSTFEGAAIGVAHVHPDGRWLRVNQRVCEITGYSEAELLQMRFQQITHAEDLPLDLAQTEKLRQGILNTFSMEKRYIRKDGSPIWVNLSVSCARKQSGELKHFISIIEDISERRDAERASARLAAIVESSDDAIVSKDLDGIIRTWNAGAERIFGYTADEVVGRSVTIIIPPELHHEEQMILRRMRNGERIEHYETVRVTKSGERLNVSLTISPMRDSKGRVIGASKIARDVSERHRVETALRESQTQLALALDSSRTAIFDWDVVNERSKWNPHLSALYQFSPAGEFVSRDEWIGLLAEDAAAIFPDADRLLQDKTQGKYEFEFRTARGGKWVLSHGRIIRDSNGRALRMIGTHTDITDRKQAEEVARVREMTGKLLHAQDAERRRIARELHDSAGQLVAALQMHLTPLKTEAERLHPEISAEITQSVDLVQQLSQELRTVSYLLHPPLLDELGLPSALRWYVEGFAERSKIDVQLDLPDHLGRLPDEMEMTLFRVVQESLTNIHRHSGSKRANITLTLSPSHIHLAVRDFGKGIRANQGNGQRLGAGVGIQGMRERVRQLNGEFKIQSHRDGTSVVTEFPLVPAAEPVTENASAQQPEIA